MKKEIHPTSHPTIFVDTSCGAEFVTNSTLKSEETKKIGDVTYQVINLEISSASHPFYTGKQVLIDTARRVEKFQERAAKQAGASSARKGKKLKKAKVNAAKKNEEKKTKKSETKKTENQPKAGHPKGEKKVSAKKEKKEVK
jgi:large subunit ribosomal protein L31